MAGPLSGIGQQQNFTQFQPGGTNAQQQTRERTDTQGQQQGTQVQQTATQPQGTQAAQSQQGNQTNNQEQRSPVFETRQADSSDSGSKGRGTVIDITV